MGGKSGLVAADGSLDPAVNILVILQVDVAAADGQLADVGGNGRFVVGV